MKSKNIFMVATLLILVGCSREHFGVTPQDTSMNEQHFSAQCLNGVEYYIRTQGYKGYMAVKINKETLQPSRCGEENN